MPRELNERQQKFLEVLFEDANGDVVAAKKLAGYSDNTPTTAIVKGLKEEILDATQMYMARNAWWVVCLTQLNLKQLWLWWVVCLTQLN